MKKFINLVFFFLIFMITSLYFYIENTKEKSYILHFNKLSIHLIDRIDDIYNRNKKLDFVSNKYFIKRKTFNKDIIVNDNIINATVYDIPFDLKFIFTKTTMELSFSTYRLDKNLCMHTAKILKDKFNSVELVQHENNILIKDNLENEKEIKNYCSSQEVKIFKVLKDYTTSKKKEDKEQKNLVKIDSKDNKDDKDKNKK